MKRYVFIIDCQVDFCEPHGSLFCPESKIVIPRIVEELDKNDIVIFTVDSHNLSDYDKTVEAASFPRHCFTVGHMECDIKSSGAAIVDDLLVKIKDVNTATVVRKSEFMALKLSSCVSSISPSDEICIMGGLTSVCVLNNALYLRSLFPKNRIVVKEELTFDNCEQDKTIAMCIMEKNLIVI